MIHSRSNNRLDRPSTGYIGLSGASNDSAQTIAKPARGSDNVQTPVHDEQRAKEKVKIGKILDQIHQAFFCELSLQIRQSHVVSHVHDTLDYCELKM